MAKKRTTPFVCFYCGKEKEPSESSDEHIVPSCIGGSRNVTLTDEVCLGCNAFMDRFVDRPFARDWFIEAARLLAGIAHRKKPPVTYMGQIEWTRPETLSLTVTEQGVSIIEIGHANYDPAPLVVGMDPDVPEQVEHVVKVLKARFPGQPVWNFSPGPPGDHEKALVDALIALPTPYKVKNKVSVVAWHRELVKIALGLACKNLPGFVSSPSADRLRAFLAEHDADKREQMMLPGNVGVLNAGPTITRGWHPGGDEHLFAIIEVDHRLALVANLFGRYENIVEIDATGQFAGALPGSPPMRGLAWIVDGVAKTTRGPIPLVELLRS